MDLKNLPKSGLNLLSASSWRLPNFIICGGMKCGTTSLHWILNQHPQIFISEIEPHFFTIDDIEQNPEFFLKTKKEWPSWNFEENFQEYIPWYANFFNRAQENQLIGEDCVSYLSSTKVAERIVALIPDVKLIFMLRDPVARTYSQYWHWVKTNRAIYSFEDTLQFSPGHLIQRSFYRQHLETYFSFVSREQIKIIIFEEFVSNVQKTVNEVCDFLGLKESLDVSQTDTHINKALVPRNLKLQLLFNSILKTNISGRKYMSHHLPNSNPENYPYRLSLINRWFQQVNLTSKKEYPPMKVETRQFLEGLFFTKNKGLSDLIGICLGQFWPCMQKD